MSSIIITFCNSGNLFCNSIPLYYTTNKYLAYVYKQVYNYINKLNCIFWGVNMLLNRKLFDKWNKDDLAVLTNNAEEYRENETLEYKKNFAFLESEDNKEYKKDKKREFRNDICSFANSDGGYLIYGISDNNGTPNNLDGIEINNTDKFELDRRNDLETIQPVMPNIKFNFIKLENEKYIVVIYVSKGFFSPYIVKDNEDKYSFYKRQGNSKRMMSYNEVRNMFNQSLILSDEIQKFRNKRIDYFLNNSSEFPFVLLHIIPDQFLNITSYNKMFFKEQEDPYIFYRIFNNYCNEYSMPFVDGLVFLNNAKSNYKVYIYNNGIVELNYSLLNYYHTEKDKNYLYINDIINRLDNFTKAYINHSLIFTENKRLFLCVSILNCNGYRTDTDYDNDYYGYIYGNKVMCIPIELYDLSDKVLVENAIRDLKTTICLSTGVKNISKYIK